MPSWHQPHLESHWQKILDRDANPEIPLICIGQQTGIIKYWPVDSSHLQTKQQFADKPIIIKITRQIQPSHQLVAYVHNAF